MQLLCQLLWDEAYDRNGEDVPKIPAAAVDLVAAKALETGGNIFEWIWDGLPPAEKVFFSAVAQAGEERALSTHAEILEILQRHGIRMLTRELEMAPDTLVKWGMLHQQGDQFYAQTLALHPGLHILTADLIALAGKGKRVIVSDDPLLDVTERGGQIDLLSQRPMQIRHSW